MCVLGMFCIERTLLVCMYVPVDNSIMYVLEFCCLGNHESETMNKMYGFEGEVKSKYSSVMAELFTEVFNYLPLAHIIEGKILVRCRSLAIETFIYVPILLTLYYVYVGHFLV